MNTHKNARLTYLRRLEMVQDITLRGLSASEAAAAAGVSAVTARKWLGRFLADGAQALLDKTSRPAKSPRAIEPGVALAIIELRRKLYLQAHIASVRISAIVDAHFRLIVDGKSGLPWAAPGRRAGTGWNVSESSTISLKRPAVVRVSGLVLIPT